MTYIPPPRDLPAFPDLVRVRAKTPVRGGGIRRRRWTDRDGNLYEWDYQHGRLEKYSERVNHLGEFDAQTGAQTKPADPGRTIEPCCDTGDVPMSQTPVRTLACFSKDGDSLVWEIPLTGIDLGTLQRLFGVEADDPMYEEFVVGPKQAAILQRSVPEEIDLESREYHVGCCTVEEGDPWSASVADESASLGR